MTVPTLQELLAVTCRKTLRYAVGLNRPTIERVRFMKAINHSVRCFD